MTLLEGRTVLVVDDEEDIREFLRSELELEGARVLEAASGRAALELLRSKTVHAVISDVVMPDGNGVELLDWIRGGNVFAPVVLFMSGFSRLDVDEALARGCDGVFPKPFNTRAMLERVSRLTGDRILLERRQGARTGNLQIHQSFDDFASAMSRGDFLLGRGGFFLRGAVYPRGVDLPVYFRIEFASGSPSLLEGQGVVRWVKNQGVGVEFDRLPAPVQAQVEELVARLKPLAFIPRGDKAPATGF